MILYPENIFKKTFAMLKRTMQGDMEDKSWYGRNCKECQTYDFL